MSKTSTRYYVYSKNSTTQKPLKNASTRQAAREWKNSQATPSNFGIFDRDTNSAVH